MQTHCKKIYLSMPMNSKPAIDYALRVAMEIEDLGHIVINKEMLNSASEEFNFIEAIDLISQAEILVVDIADGRNEQAHAELNFVSGWNECLAKVNRGMSIKIFGFSESSGILKPKLFSELKSIPSAGVSHRALGIIEQWGSFLGGKQNMLNELRRLHVIVRIKTLEEMKEVEGAVVKDDGVEINGDLFGGELVNLCGNIADISLEQDGSIDIGEYRLNSDMYVLLSKEEIVEMRRLR